MCWDIDLVCCSLLFFSLLTMVESDQNVIVENSKIHHRRQVSDSLISLVELCPVRLVSAEVCLVRP